MDTDLVKYAIVIGCAVALFVFARLASGKDEVHQFPQSLQPESNRLEDSPSVPLTGSDIPFPFDLRELESVYGSDYVRPNVVNYYFDEIDLATGPPDPSSFMDNFHIILRYPEQGRVDFPSDYLIATPSGLDKKLQDNPEKHLLLLKTIVVSRYDLQNILRAVMLDVAGPNEPDDEEPLKLPGE